MRKFVLIQNNAYCMFFLAIDFLKFCPAGTSPGCIGIVDASV